MAELIVFYVVFFVLLAGLTTYLLLDRFKLNSDEKRRALMDKIVKIGVIAFVAISFIDIFMPDGFSYRYFYDIGLLHKNRNVFHAFLRLVNASTVVVLPFAYIYKHKYLIKILAFFLLPITLASCVCFWQYLGYYQSSLAQCPFGAWSRELFTNGYFRGALFGIINLIALGAGLYTVLWNEDKLLFESKKEILPFILIFFGCLFINMPIQFPQMFLGTFLDSFGFGIGTGAHLAWIGMMAFGGIYLYFMFRNQPMEEKHMLLLMMTISLLFQYNSFFRSEGIITVTRMPFQLCNIAAVFYLITLIFKSEKMYHVVLVINFVGAVIAVALCDSTYVDGVPAGVLYCMNIHYMVEHTKVLLIPLLMGVFKLFNPLKLKHLRHTLAGYSIYFASVMLIGVVCNGLSHQLNNSYFECNFFFMFNRAAATRLVGDWVGFVFDAKITLFNYYTLTLANLFVYLVFMAICILFFMMFYAFFKDKKTLKTVEYERTH